MKTVILQAVEIVRDEYPPYLLVVANQYDGRYLKRTHNWRFTIPVHMQDIFERAYIECRAERVWWQELLFVIDDNGLFY